MREDGFPHSPASPDEDSTGPATQGSPIDGAHATPPDGSMPPLNVFTPIPVAERLRDAAKKQHTTARPMPILQPGQRYEYGFSQPEAIPPYAGPVSSSWQAAPSAPYTQVDGPNPMPTPGLHPPGPLQGNTIYPPQPTYSAPVADPEDRTPRPLAAAPSFDDFWDGQPAQPQTFIPLTHAHDVWSQPGPTEEMPRPEDAYLPPAPFSQPYAYGGEDAASLPQGLPYDEMLENTGRFGSAHEEARPMVSLRPPLPLSTEALHAAKTSPTVSAAATVPSRPAPAAQNQPDAHNRPSAVGTPSPQKTSSAPPPPKNTNPPQGQTVYQKTATPPTQPPPQSTPEPPIKAPFRFSWKKGLNGILAAALVFVAYQVGQLVYGYMQNEKEVKAVQEEYYASAGVDLSHDATRVQLLPQGETFAPTATPQPVQAASPHPAAAAVVDTSSTADTQAQDSFPVPETAQPNTGRTKATRYPDNPLNNILEPFPTLRSENPDIVGQLTINGLVDELVVRRNNTFYLTHNAYGAFSSTGAVFVDEACHLEKPPENLLLRGQSAFTGKVLAPLWHYQTDGAAFVRQNAFLQFSSLYEEGQYVLFAVIAADSNPASAGYFNYAAYPTFQNDSQMESFLALARQHSLYDIPIEVLPSDRLLTLATFTGDSGSATLVLLARQLRPGETAASLSISLGSVKEK